MKLFKDYAKEPYSFLLKVVLPYHQIIHYDLGRTYCKITVTEKFKAIDSKIEQYKAQYDLDIQIANISALPSGNVHKHECWTGKYVLR